MEHWPPGLNGPPEATQGPQVHGAYHGSRHRDVTRWFTTVMVRISNRIRAALRTLPRAFLQMRQDPFRRGFAQWRDGTATSRISFSWLVGPLGFEPRTNGL